MRFVPFLALFFLSGACGLIYEIVWSRMLVVVFGGTTFAITTILACFMGGLAVGSYVGGRLAPRLSRPGRAYGWIEIGIGLFCLTVPALFLAATPVYRGLVALGGGSFVILTTARVVVSFVILIVPTGLMGATLPLLSQALIRNHDELSGRVAGLYGWNTIGACAGCAVAGFVLVPMLGLRGAIWVAAGLNLAIGLTALWLSRRTVAEEPASPVVENPMDSGPTEESPIGPGPLLMLYGLSGFAAMAYQVAWTRALILSMGSSTYAFTSIVTCFILGLALGSLVISAIQSFASVKRLLTRHASLAVGVLQFGVGLSALVVVPLFGEMPGWVARLSGESGISYLQVLSAEFVYVLALLILPTLFMGALLPLVCRLYVRRTGLVGRGVGNVYAANTLGTIAGAFITGFVLIPLEGVGMQRGIVLASALSGLIGSIFIMAGSRSRMRALALVACAWVIGIGVVSVTSPWSRAVMVSGPYLAFGPSTGPFLYYREGIDTTVAVTQEANGERVLTVNGKPDASDTYTDKVTQFLLGHIPMLLSPDAQEVFVVGLGSGATVGAVLTHPVERVVVAEISAAVVEGARHFEEINGGVFDDPRANIVRADGRNHLLLDDARYDLIISEPSNPWMSGVANLFTREFFELARSRLSPGGLHCQWVQGYSIRSDDLASVLRTLGTVFPHTQLWETNFNEYLVVGSDRPILFDLERMYLAMGRPRTARSLSSILVLDPMQIAAFFVADGEHMADWISSAPILTDERPSLEFTASRFLLQSDEDRIRERFASFRGFPEFAEGTDSVLAGEFLEALDRGRRRRVVMKQIFDAGRAKIPEPLMDGLVQLARTGSTDPRIAVYLLQMLTVLHESPKPQLEAYVPQATREVLRAMPILHRLRRGPSAQSPLPPPWPFGRGPEEETADVKALVDAVRRTTSEGQAADALADGRALLEKAPDSWIGLAAVGTSLVTLEEPDAALPYLLKAWVRQPTSGTLAHRLARVYSEQARPAMARSFLEIAIDHGFAEREALASDPLLAPLLADILSPVGIGNAQRPAPKRARE